METQILEFDLSKQVLSDISKILILGTEFADIVAEGNNCIISTETKGFIFATKINLTRTTEQLAIRIPTQVMRQFDTCYSKVRIFIRESSLQIALFKTDLQSKPVVADVQKSICSLDYFNTVAYAFANTEGGKDSELVAALPVISAISKCISGLAVKSFLVGNGVMYIDSPIMKFFCDLERSNLNIVLPSLIMKYMQNSEEVKQLRHLTANGYHILVSNHFIYCWKSVRSMVVNEYEILKTLEPNEIYAAQLGDAVSFLRNIKISANREQECVLDLQEKYLRVKENIISTYNIPIECQEIQVKQNMLTQKGAGRPKGVASVDLKELLSITKDLEKDQVLIRLHNDLVEIIVTRNLPKIGQYDLRFIIKQRR